MEGGAKFLEQLGNILPINHVGQKGLVVRYGEGRYILFQGGDERSQNFPSQIALRSLGGIRGGETCITRTTVRKRPTEEETYG